MASFASFRSPHTIHYGRHSFQKVGIEATEKGRHALIISDQVMQQVGHVDDCQHQLKNIGVECKHYLGIESEPTDVYVQEALEVFKRENCDLIISLGGGSCIDTAKAVAVVATNGGYIGDYAGGKVVAKKKPIPHIAIPTTAGTGSEATDVTVITNTSNDVKMMIKQPAFLPEVAIVDPLLTMTAPKNITAATGVDALCHAIEAYISRQAQPMTDKLALAAMERIVNNIMTAYEDGKNMDAREAMSLGSLQAGLAFSNASVCLIHGMSRPIGALFHVPHGISNAMLLPAVLEFSQEAAINRLADLGKIFAPDAKDLSNAEAAEMAVSSVKRLCKRLNIPNLKGWGLPQKEFENAISKMVQDALESGSPGNNPKVPTWEEVENLYKVCFDYDLAAPR